MNTPSKIKHLRDCSCLDTTTLSSLFERAHGFTQATPPLIRGQASLATVFFETSTRTRVSFTVAAQRLGFHVVNIDADHSAHQKGETLEDTLLTLEAMGIAVIVLRHPDNDSAERASRVLSPHTVFINAGSGSRAHPSQALLDAMTIVHHKSDVSDRSIAIVGDLKHSRVASSTIAVLKTLQFGEIRLIAPPAFQTDTLTDTRTLYYDTLDEGLDKVDVVMMLRIQKERLTANTLLDESAYRKDYQLTPQRLQLAKPDAILMHPGPVNRGIELHDDCVYASQSVILQQVQFGVQLRMALLAWLFNVQADTQKMTA